MTFDVVVIGSANLDLVASTPRLPRPGETVLGTHFAQHPGGKGLNQAVAASRLGASVAFIGCVGDDDAGGVLRSVALDEGIDVSLLSVEAGCPTGRAMIAVDENAENSIVVIAGANTRVAPTAAPSAAVVLVQLEIPLDTVVAACRAARASGTRTVLNPAPAPPDGLPRELLECCDVIVPNEHELELLGGADALLAGGVGAVVVTRGSAGVTIVEAQAGGQPSRSRAIPAFEVDPVDTTGAGDAFCGTLAARLAAGDPLDTAARAAAAAGALATTVAGAVPSLPLASAVERLLSR
jgi:ribokinase